MDLGVSTPLLDDGFVFTILQTLQLKQGSAYEAPRQLVAPQASQSFPPQRSQTHSAAPAGPNSAHKGSVHHRRRGRRVKPGRQCLQRAYTCLPTLPQQTTQPIEVSITATDHHNDRTVRIKRDLARQKCRYPRGTRWLGQQLRTLE